MESIGNLWLYLVFFAIVAVMLAIDLLGFKQKAGESVKVKTAAYWSIAWVSVAALFGGGLWLYLKHSVGLEVANTKVMEYFAGYLLEKSITSDNVFVGAYLPHSPFQSAYSVKFYSTAYWAQLFSEPFLFLLGLGSYKNSLGFCIFLAHFWFIQALNSVRPRTRSQQY